ncbi:hypothetical protein [Dethiosulfatarculus sandiegensis]|uniref:hypothetical protein n=1 Tax=Dethiosulfatarculus sandiegensis TaxID=1429043 RepID=UPI0012E22674|nr:hypothetical protein [Dethiosulfatarculus sandiegensis]
MKTVKFFLLLMGATYFCSTALAQQTPKLYGITIEDKYPHGCVDCHVQSGNLDYRINVRLKKYYPDHPDINKENLTVPRSCKKCHGEDKEAETMSVISHKVHYHKLSAKNDFIKYYQGKCLSCHQLNPSTGQMTLKNGPKNW